MAELCANSLAPNHLGHARGQLQSSGCHVSHTPRRTAAGSAFPHPSATAGTGNHPCPAHRALLSHQHCPPGPFAPAWLSGHRAAGTGYGRAAEIRVTDPWNILGWKGPTGITKFSSWPCTRIVESGSWSCTGQPQAVGGNNFSLLIVHESSLSLQASLAFTPGAAEHSPPSLAHWEAVLWEMRAGQTVCQGSTLVWPSLAQRLFEPCAKTMG